MKIALALLAVLLVILAVALLPLPIRPYLDFQVIYHADMGLLRGIPLYDHAGQVDMIAQLAHVPPSQVFVLPFPYPPWYALSTLWLALLPIDLAARLWFGLNLIMLFASVSLLTTGARAAARLLSFLLGMIWLPALGSLFVGQYGFPVLLGAALMIFALRRENALLTACAAALLTFKPHIGAPLLLMVLAYLWLRRDRFGRRAAAAVLAAGAILFVAGFAASPLWPLDYYRSLTGFRDVSQCHQCVSLSMAIAGAAGGALDQAVWIALLIAVVLIAWLVASWRLVAGSAGRLVTTGLLVTLLMSPYLQNYDYLVLLIPFMEFGRDAKGRDWLWLALAYVLPPISVAFFGVAGSLSLVLSALILFALAARRSDAKAAKPSVSRPA